MEKVRRLIALQALVFKRRVIFKPNSTQDNFHLRYIERDSSIGILGKPSGKFDYYILYNTPKNKWRPVDSYRWGEEFKEEDKKDQKNAKRSINALEDEKLEVPR